MADPSPASGDAVLAPAASDAPEAALPAAPADLDKEFGFQREELYKEKLAGTVGLHERHVFLCYKGPEEWPSRLEATDSDTPPGLLAAAIKARKPDLKKSTKLTICEGEVGTESSLGDMLIFPDMIRYRGLTHVDVDTFVEEVLVKDTEWLAGSPEAIEGSYVFVCSHGSRDKRCGVCGPVLIARFKEEIEGHGLDGKVAVSACSHVGGHKYAGNVIIFSSDAKGEVTGHWGQLGLSEEQQKEALELRHAKETPEANGTNGAPAGGCCQGNGSRSNCCQSDQPEEKQDKSIPAEQNHKSSTTESDKESVAGKKGRMKICQMPTWFETWDRSDTYTTLAVVGAAATVFVAFRCYKTMN